MSKKHSKISVDVSVDEQLKMIWDELLLILERLRKLEAREK